MPIDPSLNNDLYKVNTPPLIPERTQGHVISLMNIDQMRYMAFEPFSGSQLPCGVIVTGATNAMGKTIVTQPTVAGSPLLGVSIWNQQRLLVWDNTLQCYSYQTDEMVSLLEEGDIVMYSEVATEVGQPVFSRFAADAALTRIGALSNVPGVGLEAVPRAKFLERAIAGLVRIHVDF